LKHRHSTSNPAPVMNSPGIASYTESYWRYNDRVHMRYVSAMVVMSAAMLAVSNPPSCPAGRPVDDIIAEVNKQQSKKAHRNPNPLPEVICIGGLCFDHSRKQKTAPEAVPQGETPSDPNTSSSRSNTIPVDECDDKMEMTLKAAHDVDVGDYYFEQKNYHGALLRYNDALEEKPGDIAIHVRLGRAFEKLNQVPQAIEQYKTAQTLDGPEKWSDEAKAALLRLQPPSAS
jgi:tetratricopeptide (TPR) repeat protein